MVLIISSAFSGFNVFTGVRVMDGICVGVREMTSGVALCSEGIGESEGVREMTSDVGICLLGVSEGIGVRKTTSLVAIWSIWVDCSVGAASPHPARMNATITERENLRIFFSIAPFSSTFWSYGIPITSRSILIMKLFISIPGEVFKLILPAT
jgi:hypothetical protein